MGRVLSRPLDPAKPLWELYVFEGLAERRTAVLLKMHHALADGISGMTIASALFDLAPDAEIGAPPATPWVPEQPPSRDDLLRDAAQDLVLHPLEAIGHAVSAPARTLGVIAETLSGVRDVVDMGAPPGGPFDTDIGPARRFAMAEASFARIHEIKRALGGTVNDIVLTAVAGGLHDLLEHRGEPTKGRTLRVMVPVSVRSKAEQGEVGNRVAPAFVDVPVGPLRARTRLQRVRRATAQLKGSTMALSADSIIGLGAYAPPALHAMAARLASRGRWFNLVVSNVPAPQVPALPRRRAARRELPGHAARRTQRAVGGLHEPGGHHGLRAHRRLGFRARRRGAGARHRDGGRRTREGAAAAPTRPAAR